MSFILGEYIDSVLIFVVSIINSIFGFIQEYKAEKTFEMLEKVIKPTCCVIRNGEKIIIESGEVVKGDLIALSIGDSIPSNSIVIESTDFSVKESVLTGEEEPVFKKKTMKFLQEQQYCRVKRLLEQKKLGQIQNF